MQNSTAASEKSESRFEVFFQDSLYLLYKNHLYNYRVRRRSLRKWAGNISGKRILELGAGISPALSPHPGIVQTDLSWQALRCLRKNSHTRPVACDGTLLPFMPESFDTVICSEVIEHVPNDFQLLEEIFRVLKPGGGLLLSCPVHPEYFGFDDAFVGHRRRYEIPELTGRLEKSGFTGVRVRPLLGMLDKFLMVTATRIFSLRKRKASSGAGNKIGKSFAWFFFPVYWLMNLLLSGVVGLQARKCTLDRTASACFQCKKPN